MLSLTKEQQQQTDAFMDVLDCGTTCIGPAGVKRDDSLEFVQECLLPPKIGIIIMDPETLEEFVFGL